MLNKIIQFSIKNKLAIGLMVLALIVWGIYSLKQLPIDAVPDITDNQVQIITQSPSNGAEDIERFVTFPIEQTMATIPSIEETRSFSRFGLSIVTIVFKENIDVYWARQQVSERLVEASKQIPSGLGKPQLAPVTTGLGEIYQYVLHTKKGYEEKYNVTDLRTIQDWIVRRQLLGVEGIADVSSFGGNMKQYEIALNTDKLRSMNISITDVFTALEKNNQNTGGAYIDKKPNAYFIRSEGLITSMEDIENIVVKTNDNNIPVLIRNVGVVQFGTATRYGAMTRNNEGEVAGAIVMMLKGANSSATINKVKERIAQIEKTLPEGITIDPYLDRTKLVDNAIGTVTKNLAEGALIVIFVLVLMLGNMRAGLIVASVIPLAMLFAISLMNLFGVSGNLMSLGAIDFGLIIDGAVIIIDATLHHLFEKHKGQQLNQQQMDESVLGNARKMMSSAAFGQIIILIVYLPILALVGVEGRMFKPMAQTVSFAILGAFLLSLTYIPMMSALFLNKKISTKKNISDTLMAFFQRIFTPALNFTLKSKRLVVCIAVGLLVLSMIVFNFLGSEFIPTLDEGDFAVETRVLTGSSMSQTIEAVQHGAKVLKDNFPEVKEVIGKIGSSEIPTDPMPVEAADMIVVLKNKSEWTSAKTRDELAEKMNAKLMDNIPGVSYSFQQPIQMRFNELMTGAKQDVVIKIFGEDLNKLTQYAKQVGAIAKKTDGAEDVYVEEVTGLPQIVIKFHRDKIAQFGLNIEDINKAIRTAFAGESAGLVFEAEKRFDLVVRLEKDNRKNLEDIRGLFVTAPKGNQIPIEQLADIDFVEGPNQIQRDDAKRRIIIGFNIRGRDVASIVKEMQQKIDAQIKFEAGYYTSYGGQFKNLEAARARLSFALPVALLLIFAILFFTFNSLKQSLLIFTAIPLSAIGGVFALWIRGMPFSISAGVGFIALFGVAVLNGIVLIAEFNRLKNEGMTNLTEIVKQGTAIRLRPVIMTALVASLGFLPMALSHGSGAEVQKPLATVVIGGLLTATLLTLLVLPILYIWVEKIRSKKVTISPTAATIILLLVCSFTNAQIPPISLEQALQQAVQNNKSITTGKLEIDYQKKYKKSLTEIPKTNIGLQYGQYNSINKTDNHFTASQIIPFPTVFAANKALGNSLIKGSELKLTVTQNELQYQVKQVYGSLQYLYAHKQLLIQQDSIYKGFVKSAALRYKTGEGNLLAKITAETQSNEVKYLLLQNHTDIQIYLAQLETLLASKESIVISDTAFSEKDISIPTDTAAINTNPFLAYLQQQIDIATKQKKAEAAKSLPDITAAYFNQSLIGFQNVNGTDKYFDGSKRFQGFQVGVGIAIFNGTGKAKVKAAEVNKQIAGNNYELNQTEIKSKYQQAVLEYLKNKNSIAYYKTSALPNADLILKQTIASYSKGEIGYPEYLMGIKNAIGIKETYLKALHQYNQSIINIEYLSGKK